MSDWTLTLDVVARIPGLAEPPGAAITQRLTVAANGEVVGSFEVTDPGPVNLVCTVQGRLLAGRDELVLTFLHPDGEPPARVGLPDADWRESVGFRRIALSRRF